jgi:hypothetical protein
VQFRKWWTAPAIRRSLSRPKHSVGASSAGYGIMPGALSGKVQTLLQILAVFGMILIVSMIAHGGYVDISALAHRHSGEQFWSALAQYLLRNLAGG